LKVTRQEWWQSNVEHAARNAFARQRRNALMAELEATINPPLPAPEPEVIYVEPEEGTGRLGYSDFSPELMKQPVRWRW
jgi:hypothetical protein